MIRPLLLGTLIALLALATNAANTPRLRDVAHPDATRFEVGLRNLLERHHRALTVAAPSEAGAAWGELGMAYLAHGLHRPAAGCFANAAALAPNMSRWPHLEGVARRELGELDTAAARFLVALNIAPDAHATRLRLAKLWFEIGDYGRANNQFNTLLQRQPDFAAAQAGLGEVALAQRHYRAAVSLLEAALHNEPDANQLHYLLAQAYRQTGDLKRAREHIAQRGFVAPGSGDVAMQAVLALRDTSQHHIKLGLSAYAKGDIEATTDAYRAAVDANPNIADNQLALAWVLELGGDLYGAQRHAQHALDLAPGLAKAHYQLGRVAELGRDDARAISHYTSALRGDPGAVPPRALLADALLRTGASKLAYEHYLDLIEQEPGEPLHRYRAAVAALNAGDCDAAAGRLAQSLKLEPRSADVAETLIRVNATCPDRSETQRRRALELAQQLDQALPDAGYDVALAMALAGVGQFTDAAKLQREIIAGSPAASLPSLRADLRRYEAGHPAPRAWPADAALFRPSRLRD